MMISIEHGESHSLQICGGNILVKQPLFKQTDRRTKNHRIDAHLLEDGRMDIFIVEWHFILLSFYSFGS